MAAIEKPIRRRSRAILSGAGRLAAVGALVAVAAGASWAVTLRVAALTTRPELFLAAGAVTGGAVFGGSGWLLTRRQPPAMRRRWRRIGAACAAVGLVLPAGFLVLVPATPAAGSGGPPGVRFLTRADGTRLALHGYSAARAKSATGHRTAPIVFLHGGPGVADMAHDGPYFASLTETGRDVWLYDQLGAGNSSRLSDPRGYGLQRDIDDLEAVRQYLGVDRMVLLGYSYGATLAASYLARYPDRVERVVFTSPGRLVPVPGDVSGTGVIGRLTGAQRLAALTVLLRPRAMMAWSLVKSDPRSAQAFAGDNEMDARFATLYRTTAAGLVCPRSPVPPVPDRPGFYANQVPLSDQTKQPDIRPALALVRVPALVIKGGCDYLPWSFAIEYREAIPGARLVYLADAGHQSYTEQPERFRALLIAFLTDRPLPLPTWTADLPPQSYRGQAG